jgi:hypothetical protein
MMDAIGKAANIANSAQGAAAKAQGTADAVNGAIAGAAGKADALSAKLDSLEGKLPLDKDPELIKREIEADILEKEAKIKEMLMVDREKLIEDAKSKLKALALATLPLPLKVPLIDPKILQAVALAKQIKKLLKERKNIAKKYLSKGKELYTYPIKQYDLDLPTKPTVPSLPKPPSVPKLPIKSNPRPNT